MSVLTYIASDYPLKEVENQYIKRLSVNQALEIGIEVSDFLLSSSFDKDKSDVILWIDDEKNYGEISIRTFCKNDLFDDIYTKKKFVAYLEWTYTKNRAENLIQYINFHLIVAEELELWSIWLGEHFDGKKIEIKKHHIHIEQLTVLDLKKYSTKTILNFQNALLYHEYNDAYYFFRLLE